MSATRARVGVDERDVVARGHEALGRREACDAATHDDRPHGAHV